MRKCLLLSLILITISIFAYGSISASAETEGAYTYSVSNGEATITKYNDSATGTIVIPDTIAGYPVTTIGIDAFRYSKLTAITIPDSVTSIGENAFSWCESLKIITIPDSVTSIGEYAFFGCNYRSTVYYTGTQEEWDNINIYSGNDNLKNAKIIYSCGIEGIYAYSVSKGEAAIVDCDESASGTIVIPDTLGGYPVTSIGEYAFSNCTSLTCIIIPNSVTAIDKSAFSNCTSLTCITVPNSVTTIDESAFSDCKSLTSITIPDGVTRIGDYAFGGCYSLTSITIGNGVTSIGDYAFIWCESLTTITIPDGVTSVGNFAFSNCKSLTNLTIPNNVTTIGESAFTQCYSLASITIGNGVTSIGDFAFSECKSLTNINVNEDNANYSSASGVIFNKDKTELITYPCGKRDTEYIIPDSVTTIGDYAFSNCTSLTCITIPNSVTTIDKGAFCDCESLTTLTIPDSVTSIGDYTFSWCESLTTITIPDSVTSIGDYAFHCCTSLTTLTIPNGVTHIGDCTLEYCSSLKSITIPNSVTSIGNFAIFDCPALTDVYYQGTETEWNKIKIALNNTDLERINITFLNKSEITVKINDVPIIFDQQPIIENGRTLVPLRAIFEALGAEVTWNGDTQTVTATKGETQISLRIGSTQMYVNESIKTIDVPAKLINSRTLVPVRAISEAFGCKVDWIQDSQTVVITN